MHLKTLTLRGFKSFTSSTTLHFEPGITCVVGPNGSGKSNVVDALAWVMGEQGAKTLRGGKMEDVIFAGTAGRPALGRAEVVLTIDNTDGALPIDFAEVTISRTMFRNGGSEYAINGQHCRLLDVQELLSDSGIGREMHVIVGQGQLDNILTATPEDRRGFVEEAAGVLKHRKRKEKALRKVEATQANLTRLQDLTAELRRQLKPLGRQAEVARRAQIIQADVRDARLRLLADDLVQLTSTLEQEDADETALRQRQAEVAQQLAAARAKDAELEAIVTAESPRMARAQETWYRLSSLRERLRGTAELSGERLRHLSSQSDEPPPGRDPEDMEAEARRIRAQEAELTQAAERARAKLDGAVTSRNEAEAAADNAERRYAELLRAAADRRAGIARLTERVEGLRRKIEAADAEIERLGEARQAALAQAARAQQEFTALESTIAGLSAGEEGLDAQHEAAAAELAELEAALAALREEDRAAERERAALVARREALEMGLARKDGGAALLAASDQLGGVLGSVAALLQVKPGWEAAVAAALGRAAEAVAVAGADEALAALRHLTEEDLGQATLLVARPPGDGPPPDGRAGLRLPDGMHRALDLINAPAELQAPISRLLGNVVAVPDLPAAAALVAELPELVAVTPEGELLGHDVAFGGTAKAQSMLEIQAAVDDVTDKISATTRHAEQLRRRIAAAEEAHQAAAERVQAALARLYESDAEMSAVAERLGQLGQATRLATAEVERLRETADKAARTRDADQTTLEELEGRLAGAGDPEPDSGEPSPEERDATATTARQARQAEMEARLALRTSEERLRALTGRAEGLERSARRERETRARLLARRERRAREAAVVTAVGRAVDLTLAAAEGSLRLAAEERAAAERRRDEVAAQASDVRAEVRRLSEELDELTSVVHRDEVARAEHRMRIEQLQTKVLEEYGVDPEALVNEYGPHLPVPQSSPPAPRSKDGQADRVDQAGQADLLADEEPQPIPYVRAEQEKRAKRAERELALLGKVNPLALEEFAALEERHRFLTEQLEDLKRTRKDLLDIVREVDERVERVFAEAYADVAREFETVFARLFPGGEGRLVLTDPSDMLTTGIDVEARPPGKKVKRLSLLSGGERSLVAVAFLVSLFRARPSPFYVLDEVEAALDDTNLGRLLEIYEELRETSQLIVITHQKRTMEIADALYGTSMRGDGVTQVISQRLREAEPA